MDTINDGLKTKAQLLAELQTLRAQMASFTMRDVDPPVGDRHLPHLMSRRAAAEIVSIDVAHGLSDVGMRDTVHRSEVVADLRNILAIVNSSHTVDDLLGQLIREACRLLGANAGAIYRLREADTVLRLRAAHNLAAVAAVASVPVGWGPIGRAVMDCLPVATALGDAAVGDAAAAIEDSEQLAHWTALTQRYGALLAVPVVIRDEVYGAITLFQQAACTFTPTEIDLALAFAAHTALAIENVRLFAMAQDTAAFEERQRLARELHDSVTQTLYVIKLYAEAAARRMSTGDTGAATEYLYQLRHAAHEALQEIRVLIFELRPPILEQEGLAMAIQARLEAVEERTGLKPTFTLEGEHRPTIAVEQALYRVAQEALNNIHKHAEARTVAVSLRQEPLYTQLSVVDDGIGFDSGVNAGLGGFGLRGMAERVALLGGYLTVESTPGQGTVVRVEVSS